MKIKKQTFAWIIFALFTFVLMSPNLLAQQKEEESTATLQEIMDWIGTKLTTWGFIGRIFASNDIYDPRDSYNSSKRNYEINKCSVTFKEVGITYEKKSYDKSITVSFSDIDPLTVKESHVNIGGGYGYLIDMETTSPKRTINFIKDGEQELGSIISFQFYDSNEHHENEQRTLKALKHAIKLCGGKVDPF